MLEIKGLDVFYGDIQAVLDVSLHVDEGEIVALVGANGAGKSTLLKTISGTTHAERGEIRFSGKNITNLTPQDIVDIGITHVPEGRRLFSNLTVLENLKLGAYIPRARSVITQSLEEAYDLFPVLKDRKDQKAVYNGREITFSTRTALAWLGDLQIEINHAYEVPEGGLPHTDWIKRRGEGIHHLGFMVKDTDEALKQIEPLGLKCFFRLEVAGITAAYLDTEHLFGYIYEFIGMPQRKKREKKKNK